MIEILESLANSISESCFNEIINTVETILAEGENLENTVYRVSKMVGDNKHKIVNDFLQKVYKKHKEELPKYDSEYSQNSAALGYLGKKVSDIPDSKRYLKKVGGSPTKAKILRAETTDRVDRDIKG